MSKISKGEEDRVNTLIKKNNLIYQRVIKVPSKGKYLNFADKPITEKIQDLLETSKNSIK